VLPHTHAVSWWPVMFLTTYRRELKITWVHMWKCLDILTNRTCMHKETKGRLNWSLLQFGPEMSVFQFDIPQYEDDNIQIQNYNSAHCFMCVKAWCLTLRRSIGWGWKTTGYWKRYLGIWGRQWKVNGENCVSRSFMFCNPHYIILGRSN